MKRILLVAFLGFALQLFAQTLPKGFTYLSSIDSSIQLELRYLSTDNFLGTPVDGYKKDTCIMTLPAAKALKEVQSKLAKFGLGLKIYDAYRPQQAVDHFVRWAKVMNDTLQKKKYYPNVDKKDLFNLGYIASRSGHTRGSTVDLTTIDLKTNEELDMGSTWDFFGVPSHPDYPKINKEQRANRLLLRNLMLQAGFKPYEQEWWHFTLENEPFPNTYFNFPIK